MPPVPVQGQPPQPAEGDQSASTRWHVLPLAAVQDVTTAARSRQQFVEAIVAGHTHLVADLESVTFMDSVGLGVLVGALKRVRAAGGELRVAGAGRDVLRLLRITGLSKVLRAYESVEAALVAPPETFQLVGIQPSNASSRARTALSDVASGPPHTPAPRGLHSV